MQKTELQAKDYAWTAIILFSVFVILPFTLWGWSQLRKQENEQEARKIVPTVLAETSEQMRTVARLLEEQVTSTNRYIQGTPLSSTLRQVCDAVQSSIFKQNSDYNHSMNYYNCSFFLLKDKEYFRVATDNIYNLSTGYDDENQFRLLNTSKDEWELHGDSTGYWVTYKVQSEPQVLMQFVIEPKERDYRGGFQF